MMASAFRETNRTLFGLSRSPKQTRDVLRDVCTGGQECDHREVLPSVAPEGRALRVAAKTQM